MKPSSQLDRIEGYLQLVATSLLLVERRLDIMSGQERELDQGLADLATKVASLVEAVNNLVASIPPEVNLTDEIQAVKDAAAGVQGVSDTATGATPPPAAA